MSNYLSIKRGDLIKILPEISNLIARRSWSECMYEIVNNYYEVISIRGRTLNINHNIHDFSIPNNRKYIKKCSEETTIHKPCVGDRIRILPRVINLLKYTNIDLPADIIKFRHIVIKTHSAAYSCNVYIRYKKIIYMIPSGYYRVIDRKNPGNTADISYSRFVNCLVNSDLAMTLYSINFAERNLRTKPYYKPVRIKDE